MKKITKIMAVGLLLGMVGSDVYGMKRGRENGQGRSGKIRHTESLNEEATNGKDVNAIGVDALTRLQRAAKNGKVEEVEKLLSAGANPDITGIIGYTSLHMAALEGHANVVKMLLDAGANPNEIDMYGRIPLCLAVEKGHSDVVKILIQADDNKNKADEFVRAAIAHERANVIEILLRAGANIPDDLRDNERVKRVENKIRATAFCSGMQDRLCQESPVQLLQGFSNITQFICNPDGTELQ